MFKKKKLLKHVTVKEDIKSIIYSEEFDIGEKLPSEIDLGKRLNVSRVTIRQAIGELQDEGIIIKQRGKGTVVLKKKSKFNYMLTSTGVLKDLICEDCKVTTKMIKIIEKRADKKIAEKLKIEEGAVVIAYERVRSVDGVSAVYSMDNIAKERVPEKASFENMGPSLSQSIGIDLHYTDAKIIPIKANAYICELLNIAPESICLLLEEITYDLNDKPLDYSYEYYPEHFFNFHLLRLKKD